MINYSSYTIKPSIDTTTDHVYKWIFGLTGTDSVTGVSASVDGSYDVSDQDPVKYNEWEKKNVDALCTSCEASYKFKEVISEKIAALNNKSVIPDDFDYSSLPDTI